jgi:uncharacterized protein
VREYTGDWNNDTKIKTWSYWSELGRPVKVETFNDKGVQHGKFESYSEGGKLESKGSFKDAKPNGKWEYFHPFGTPMRTCTYKMGKINGKVITYNDRGRVVEEAKYVDNKLEGEYVKYDEKTGKVLLRQIYEHGKVKEVLEGMPGKKP